MGSRLGLQPADYGFAEPNWSCRGRSISDAAAGCMGLHRIAQSHTGLRVAEGFRRVRGCCWVASNPDWGFMGSERLRPFWAFVWRVYDRPVLVRVLPRGVAPWLFGKMIGSKGTLRVVDAPVACPCGEPSPAGYPPCTFERPCSYGKGHSEERWSVEP